MVCAAGLVSKGFFNPRALTFTWSYYIFAHALLALAGFLLVVPFVWQEVRGHRRLRLHWGLLSAYLAVGVALAGALPLSMLMYMNGARAPGVLLGTWGNSPFLSTFGATLIGAGIAHALGNPAASE